ncbi:GDP-L-fucose synthase family protein [Bythopirellula goksoeyrii]|nr:GDP-L-fucose synthase [Bythopirellula goksoeyrii]
MSQTLQPQDRIFVTGHRGLVGSHVVSRLHAAGLGNVLSASREQLDLRDGRAVESWFAEAKPDYVIHTAGKVGGIGANIAEPVDFCYDNLLIQATVLRAAWQSNVKKLLYLASSCVYPRDCPQPMREEFLLTGPLETTNEGYALAKIAGLKSCQYYRRQYGCNFIAALPTNLYGPGDKFDPQSSHVIPSLILKFHQARLAGEQEVSIWGSGTPRREFLHVADLADACSFLLENYDDEEPINVGTGTDVSIAELAAIIRDIVYPEAQLVFDSTKPDGTPRKLLDVTHMQRLGWKPQHELKAGIAETYAWYLQHGNTSKNG